MYVLIWSQLYKPNSTAASVKQQNSSHDRQILLFRLKRVVETGTQFSVNLCILHHNYVGLPVCTDFIPGK